MEYFKKCFWKIYTCLYQRKIKLVTIPKVKKRLKKEMRNNIKFRETYKEELSFLLNKEIRFIPYEIQKISDINVFFDDNMKLPYTELFGKRMYFLKEYTDKNIRDCVKELLEEQSDISPHLYVDRSDDIFEKDKPIVIDVGCAEANFTLEYIEKVEEAFLFEANERWNKPLKATFSEYNEKVHIINKFVSENIIDDRYTTLDDYFSHMKGKNIVLKMDLEGYGLSVLKGARKLLKDNNVFVACACYHYDKEYTDIEEFFNKNYPEYSVESSKGVCLYFHDGDLKYPFFRKGVIRAVKRDL